MVKSININNLIGDDYQASVIGEYNRGLLLIKRLIEIADTAVSEKEEHNILTYEGICFLFARSIMSYAKMAYDNMVLGHFQATHMVIRPIIENGVFLDIIQKYREKELWKYYLIQSYWNTIMSTDREIPQGQIKFFEKICNEYNIEKDFLEKTKKNNAKKSYAYIDRNYGWTYKINRNFTFSGLCNLVNKQQDADFKMMSAYSHGTAVYQKIKGSIFTESITNMLSSIYIGLYQLVTLYCVDTISDEFYNVMDELNEVIYSYLDVEE